MGDHIIPPPSETEPTPLPAVEGLSDLTTSSQDTHVGNSQVKVSDSTKVPIPTREGFSSPGEILVDQPMDEDAHVDIRDAAIAFTKRGYDNEPHRSHSTSSEDGQDNDTLEEDFDMEYVYENGRRYANESCLYPNDDTEETRLNIAHQVRRIILGGNYTVGWISSGVKRILDVGTGPGDWAIAMGEAFPKAHVIATDITVYSPVAAPPNVEFRIEDATQDWDYNEPFDFIHMRDLVATLPDFSHMYRQATKNLKRNGTFELVTGGPIMLRNNYATSALKEWTELLNAGREASGDKSGLNATSKAAIEAAGLREMKRVHQEVSLGEWMPDESKKRVGRMILVACLEGIEAASLRALTKHLAWPLEQAQELIERVKSELLDARNEPYCELDWVVARRLMI